MIHQEADIVMFDAVMFIIIIGALLRCVVLEGPEPSSEICNMSSGTTTPGFAAHVALPLVLGPLVAVRLFPSDYADPTMRLQVVRIRTRARKLVSSVQYLTGWR